MIRTIKSILVTLLLIAMIGCASTPYEPPEPQHSYPGRIIHKHKIENPNRAAEIAKAEMERNTAVFLVSVGGVIGGAIGGLMIGSANMEALNNIRGEPYHYDIETVTGKKSSLSAFTVDLRLETV